MLVLDQEERRLGVVELERDLGGSEPPRDRMEDRARLRAIGSPAQPVSARTYAYVSQIVNCRAVSKPSTPMAT